MTQQNVKSKEEVELASKLYETDQTNNHEYAIIIATTAKREMYHTPFDKSIKRKASRPCISYCFLTIIGLAIIASIIYGAYLVFQVAESNKDYIHSFTVYGECIINETNPYWVEDNTDDSGQGFGRRLRIRRRGLLESGSTLHVDYKYKIYNVSACTPKYDKAIFQFTKEYPQQDPNISQVGDIIQCQTNENCDEITQHTAQHFRTRRTEADWTMVGGVVVCIVACCCCVCVVVIWVFMLDKMNDIRHNIFYHYRDQWKKMKTYQKINYFMNYYLRKYELNLVNEINSLITDYYPESVENNPNINSISLEKHHSNNETDTISDHSSDDY